MNDESLWDYHQTDNIQNLEIGHPRQDMLLRKIHKYLKPGSDILEIGFGDGYLLRKLSKRYRCSGADVSEKNIQQTRSLVSNVDFQISKVDGKLPYPDSKFDAFVASEVLEHMDNKELSVAVFEIRRVLRDNGLAIITVPAKENLKDSECFCPNCGHIFHKWGHKQVWNKKRIRQVFSNFDAVIITEFFTPYKGNSFFESLIGRLIWIARTLFNKWIDISGSTYLIIVRKSK